MDKKELIQFFSEFWKIESSKINEDLKLDDEMLNNRTSIRFYQFIAAIESNFDVKVTNLNNLNTFGDILKNIKSTK